MDIVLRVVFSILIYKHKKQKKTFRGEGVSL